MKFGLVGYGLWGQHHAEAIAKAPDAELTAIACSSEATAAKARERFPDVKIHLNADALINDPAIEAIDVVVPNHLHEEIGVAALNAGKHVLLEKPMALSVASCDRLIDAAKRAGKVLTIGHELRLSTQWGRIRKIVDDGAIGTPLYAHMSLFRFPYRGGSGGWRYDADKVGSWILEEPVHFYDCIMWYFEELGDPVSLMATGNARDRDATNGGAAMADNLTTIMRWPNGQYAVLTQSLSGFEHHHVMEIVGTKGSLRTWWSGAQDRTRQPSFELKLKSGDEPVENLELGASGELFELDEQLRLSVQAFREGRPIVSGEDARKRILVCLEAERSLSEGKEVKLHFD